MSQNRDHMSAIGREGGESRAASYPSRPSAQDREDASFLAVGCTGGTFDNRIEPTARK